MVSARVASWVYTFTLGKSWSVGGKHGVVELRRACVCVCGSEWVLDARGEAVRGARYAGGVDGCGSTNTKLILLLPLLRLN